MLSLVLSKQNHCNGYISLCSLSGLQTDTFHIFTDMTHFRATVVFRDYWIKLNNNVAKVICKTAFWEIIFTNYWVKIQVGPLPRGKRGFTIDGSLQGQVSPSERLNQRLSQYQIVMSRLQRMMNSRGQLRTRANLSNGFAQEIGDRKKRVGSRCQAVVPGVVP